MDLVLHQFEASPFARKARLMLGFKGLAWRSVAIPEILPKPDVLALSGGYRRTPLLQIGADVYCDTALIARVLERLAPAPALFPPSAPLAPLFAQWVDATLFWTLIPYVTQPAGVQHVFQGKSPEQLKAFAADRKPFTAGLVRRTVADATAELQRQLAALEAQLEVQQADGRGYLFGEASVADFALAHCLWFLHRAAPLASIAAPHRRLAAWYERLRAFDRPPIGTLSGAEALALAAAARDPAPARVEPGLGFEAGAEVTVTPTDYGRDPTAGTLVGLSLDEVVLRREDARAGIVHVHFPREGFQIKEQTA